MLPEEDEAEETESLAGDEQPEDVETGAYKKGVDVESSAVGAGNESIGESIKT